MKISNRTRQWIQASILLLLGLYLYETLLTGEIANYINFRFNWLAVLGGTILLAIGVVSVISLLREQPQGAHPHEHDHDQAHEHHEHDDHDGAHVHHHTHDQAHGHDHNAVVSWPVLVIIAVPLILGILVPSKPLGAAAISNSGITTTLGSSLTTLNSQQFTAAPLERNILDWVRVFSASTTPEEFANQPADVIGFVYRDARFAEDKQFMVTRFTVSCCVADAVAIGVVVEAPEAATLEQDSWVRVKGKFQVRDFDGERTPVLVAELVEPTAQPARPYLYP